MEIRKEALSSMVSVFEKMSYAMNFQIFKTLIQ